MNIKINTKGVICSLLIVDNNFLAIRNTGDLMLDYKRCHRKVSVGKNYKDKFIFINEIKRE